MRTDSVSRWSATPVMVSVIRGGESGLATRRGRGRRRRGRGLEGRALFLVVILVLISEKGIDGRRDGSSDGK